MTSTTSRLEDFISYHLQGAWRRSFSRYILAGNRRWLHVEFSRSVPCGKRWGRIKYALTEWPGTLNPITMETATIVCCVHSLIPLSLDANVQPGDFKLKVIYFTKMTCSE